MTRLMTLALLLTGLGAASAMAQQAAIVALEQESIEFVPAGGGANVTLNFEGRILQPQAGIPVASDSRDPIARFISEVVTANRGDDVDPILATWLPEERAAIREQMQNQDAFQQNQAFFLNIRGSKVVGIIHYGDFYLTYVMHDVEGIGDYIKVYPVLPSGEELYLSNRLADNFFYSRMVDMLGDYVW